MTGTPPTDDRPQTARGDEPGPAIAFPSPVVPDEQDEITVAPPDGRHLEENPAADDDPA
jgi:hypothetical protein